LLAGPLLWLLLFFVIPVGFVAAYSVGAVELFPTDTGVVSLSSWQRLLTGGSVYMGLFWKSIRMSLTVSAVVVLLAYPTGYFLAMCVGRRKYVLLLLIIAPFLTSYLLRVLAWKVILGDGGVINSFLTTTGITDEPVSWLLYSRFTVMLVLAYIWVPFVALPVFVSLDNLDRSLLEAAGDLGASRWRTFVRVTLPLSLSGVFAAFLFVFIPTLGEFVTPLLVGGTSGYMYGNSINDLFTKGLDWQTGSTLALFLLGIVAVLMAAFGRFLGARSVAR
jgi:spermidine/putrescine transport system permease protein